MCCDAGRFGVGYRRNEEVKYGYTSSNLRFPLVTYVLYAFRRGRTVFANQNRGQGNHSLAGG